MVKIRGKRGIEIVRSMTIYLMILVATAAFVLWIITTRIQGAQTEVDKLLGTDKCIKTGKTAEFYQIQINSLLEDGENNRAAKSYSEFVRCFPKKELEFEEEQLYNLAIAVYEDDNINLARALFIRYKSEFPEGRYNNVVETYLQEIA